jgi:membrane fusion protein (multidrug efflux system)
VPEEAVFSQGGERYVYRVDDGKASLVPVALGQRKSGMVEITKGLAADDTVVTAGYQKLRNGAPVMVLGAAKGAAK